MDLTVNINGVYLYGQLPPSGFGFVIEPEGFEGWDDSVSVKGDTVSRPQAHGDFDVPGLLDARIVSITGHCIAESPQRIGWFRSQLTGLLAEGSGLVSVDHLGESQSARGRLAPGTQTKFRVNGSDSRSAKFQIQLKFADPRKFGTTRTFSGGVVAAHHYGNFPAAPVMTVTGSKPSGYTITGPAGKVFAVSMPVVSGSPHTIDMATGFLTVGGVVQSGVVTSADTWAIPGGAVVTADLSGTGSAVLDVTVRDTFI